ncbi:hypothetical protein VULLAG_LOCUS22268 [Vulpes lagopus]
MPGGRRQGLGRAGVGNCCREPEVACSYTAGLVTSAPPRQQVQTGREGGRPHPGHRGHWRPGVSPPSLGSLGPARPGVAVGKTCWDSVSS